MPKKINLKSDFVKTDKKKVVFLRSITDQITVVIKKSIYEGKYQDGEQLPSLVKLAEQYNVSIATIREAIRKLEAVGLVEIQHGKGIFVNNPDVPLDWLARFTSFSEAIRRRGKVPGAKLLDSKIIPASQPVATQLSLQVGMNVIYIKRLRTADNDPIAIEESYLPADLLPDLLEKYKEPMSLYDLIESEYGIRLVSAAQMLESVLLTKDESVLLGSTPNAPALLIKTNAYDEDDVPMEFGNSLFRGDKYRYFVRLNR